MAGDRVVQARVPQRVRVNIGDVANLAGVAPSSVSRVLNRHPNVSPQMRERVEHAVRELGYEVDLVGSSLRSGSTKTVAFLVSDIANSLFADITIGAEGELRESGYALTLMSSDGASMRDEAAIRLFRSRRVDGLILALSDETDPRVNEVLSSIECPVVLLDREMAIESASVLTDHFSGMSAAVDHLVGLGHRRTALIVGPMVTRPGRRRIEAFRTAYDQRGLEVDPAMLISLPSVSARAGEDVCRDLFARPRREWPTALVVGGYQLMIGVLRYLRGRGLSIPEDVSVVSCDENPLSELHTPGITSICRDTVETGRQAASLVLSQIAEPEVQRGPVVMPTELIVRDSTAAPTARGTSGTLADGSA